MGKEDLEMNFWMLKWKWRIRGGELYDLVLGSHVINMIQSSTRTSRGLGHVERREEATL